MMDWVRRDVALLPDTQTPPKHLHMPMPVKFREWLRLTMQMVRQQHVTFMSDSLRFDVRPFFDEKARIQLKKDLGFSKIHPQMWLEIRFEGCGEGYSRLEAISTLSIRGHHDYENRVVFDKNGKSVELECVQYQLVGEVKDKCPSCNK